MEETDGWMECEHCGIAVQIMQYAHFKRIPIFNDQQIAIMFAAPQKMIAD